MKPVRLFASVAAIAALSMMPLDSVFAQRQPSPEQRIDRLEQQVREVQRRIFPRGAPADTAGFSDDPAATQSSVATLTDRLSALERQLTDILRQSEENGHRLSTLESDLSKMRTDQEQRISALEQRADAAATAAAAAPAVIEPASPTPALTPKPRTGAVSSSTPTPLTTTAATDAGEDAYTEGYKLWEAHDYDKAIASLRAFTSAYPKHRRVSWANNLIGRALLDQGQPRAAAAALLANYRGNPNGERAPDSLYYLGQALMQLGQPTQACKAYAELEDVYGARLRADLKKLLSTAKAGAKCS